MHPWHTPPSGGVGVVCGFTQPRPGQEQGRAVDVNRDAQSRSVARVGPGAGTGLNARWRWCSGWGCVKGRPFVLGLWVGLRPTDGRGGDLREWVVGVRVGWAQPPPPPLPTIEAKILLMAPWEQPPPLVRGPSTPF